MQTEVQDKKVDPIANDYFNLYKNIKNLSNSLANKSEHFGEKGAPYDKIFSNEDLNKSVKMN